MNIYHNRYPLFFFLLLFAVSQIVVAQESCFEKLRTEGMIQFKSGKYSDAKNSFINANACENAPETHDLREWIEKAHYCRVYRMQADRFLENGEKAKAREKYEKVLELNPDDIYCKGQLLKCSAAPPPPWVKVEGGTFTMGDDDGFSEEGPEHEVTLSTFYIGRYEVTNSEFCNFLNARGNQMTDSVYWIDIQSEYCLIEPNGNHFVPKEGAENLPVVKVSWYGANAYSRWMGGRLPTEAEWEFAAKGGNSSVGFTYSGSNEPTKIAWYNENAHNKPHEVGQKQANELGIYDMSGNVYEWCNDWFAMYRSAPKTNPTGPSEGRIKVCRGGAWNLPYKHLRPAHRGFFLPTERYANIGFRVVRGSP